MGLKESADQREMLVQVAPLDNLEPEGYQEMWEVQEIPAQQEKMDRMVKRVRRAETEKLDLRALEGKLDLLVCQDYQEKAKMVNGVNEDSLGPMANLVRKGIEDLQVFLANLVPEDLQE